MARKKAFKKIAYISLLFFGALVFLFGILVFAIGLALTHNDSFNEPIALKAQVRPGIDYVQYWVGLPYVFTGSSIILSAFYLRKVSLTICTLTLSLICVVLSLAGLVVDGPDFSMWKTVRAHQTYWEGEDGYACSTESGQCICKKSNTPDVTISYVTDCGTIQDLSTIYGVLIGAMAITLVVLLVCIFLIVYVVTTKREKALRSGSKYKTTTVLAVSNSDEGYLQPAANPVYDAGPVNQGFQADQARLQSNRKYKEHLYRDEDGLPLPNKETNATQNGVVVLDPGRFKLGDDDIY